MDVVREIQGHARTLALYTQTADDINTATEETENLLHKADQAQIPRILVEYRLNAGILTHEELDTGQKGRLRANLEKLTQADEPALEKTDYRLLLRAFDLWKMPAICYNIKN